MDTTQYRWLEDYRIDDGVIDAEHRKLLFQANHLRAALATHQHAHLTALLDNLLTLLRYHFAHEETLMHEVEHPLAADHAAEHRAITAEIETALSPSHNDRQWLDFVDYFLDRWIPDHLTRFDSTLRGWI